MACQSFLYPVGEEIAYQVVSWQTRKEITNSHKIFWIASSENPVTFEREIESMDLDISKGKP